MNFQTVFLSIYMKKEQLGDDWLNEIARYVYQLRFAPPPFPYALSYDKIVKRLKGPVRRIRK